MLPVGGIVGLDQLAVSLSGLVDPGSSNVIIGDLPGNCQRAMMPAFSSRRSASVAQYLETFTRAIVRLDSGIVGDCLMATSRSKPTSNCVDLPGKWVDASKTSSRIGFGCRGLALIRIRLVFGITVIYTPLQIG